MPLDPTFIVTLVGCGLLVRLVPRPRHPVAWVGSACLVLLVVGICCVAVTAALVVLAAWTAVPFAVGAAGIVGVAGAYLGGFPDIPPLEAATKPAAPENEDEDDGGGGGTKREAPVDDIPPGDGDALDWNDFDAQRADWDSRVPVGV